MKEHPRLDTVGRRPSMSSWGEKVREVDAVLGDELQEDKRAEFKKIADMGLPCYRRFNVPTKNFLKSPQSYLDTLKTEQNYVFFYPSKKREIQPKDKVINFVKATVKSDPEGSEEVLVLEYKPNEFGGNIIIDKGGHIWIEFRKGSQGPVSAGTEIPEYSAEADGFTGTFKYSSPDPEIRKMLYNTVQAIHHDEHEYLPGYYEFHLVKSDAGNSLEPKFVDYKDKKPYLEKVEKPSKTGD
jgi:hypothetical protein